jgi:hypothetical protein
MVEYRCDTSIQVFDASPVGIAMPLQSGQSSPHPSPDPDIRTHAPHAMMIIV